MDNPAASSPAWVMRWPDANLWYVFSTFRLLPSRARVAVIEAKLGNYEAAIISAKKSAELAEGKKLKDWVKKNESLIITWETLKK